MSRFDDWARGWWHRGGASKVDPASGKLRAVVVEVPVD
jgi:hypothetical protein